MNTENALILTEKIKASQLLQIYGGLLSDKQAEILRLYLDEDLGYSEIAEDLGVSRQAVYDAVRQGRSALEKFENHLRLLQNQSSGDETPVTSSREQESIVPNREQAEQVLSSLEKLAGEDIIYDTRKLRQYLKEMRGILFPDK